MKIILYIGHHKVGSTALQSFLARNWLPLARAGILYPSVEAHGFAGNLKLALGAGEAFEHLPVQIREPHSALAYRMIADVSDRPIPPQFQGLPVTAQMFRALRKQVEHLQPHTMILCSEAFSNFGEVDPDLVTRLCDVFPGAEFQTYCALRRPDEYITSWHGQRLKVGETPPALWDFGFGQYLDGIHFDYRLVVQAWQDHVPGGQMILRNYADILATGGSAEDFIAQTGLTLPADTQPARRENTSLPLAAFALMDRTNRDLGPHGAHALSLYLQNRGQDLSPVANGEIEMFGQQQRDQMADAFAPIHEDLNRIAGTPAFFPDIDEMRGTRPVPAPEAARRLLAVLSPNEMPNPVLGDYIKKLQPRF